MFKGEKLPPNADEYLPYVYEHIILRNYGGMSLESVRSMDYGEFLIHLRLCLLAESANKEFQANVAGIPTGRESKKMKKEGVPKYRKGGGMIKDVITENISLTKPLTKEDLI